MSDYKFELANRHYIQGSYDAAINVLKELLSEEPETPVYHGMLALNLLAKKRIYAAEHELKIALNLDPNLAFLYTTSAEICILKNEFNTALSMCDQALTIEIDNTRALLLKSTIYRQLDQYKKALYSLQQAAKISPNSVDIHTAFGELYYEIGKTKKAHYYATQALQTNPESINANLLMGNVQLSLNNIEEAEYHAKFSISQDSNNSAALTLFTDIKMRQNLIFGFWWRFNSIVSNFSHLKSTMILIGAYLFFNLLAQTIEDLGYPKTSQFISLSWLAFVIYTWVGIPYYQRKLQNELQKFSFNSEF